MRYFFVDREDRRLLAVRHGHVQQNRIEVIGIGRLPEASHGLVELFRQSAAALAGGVGNGAPNGSVNSRGHPRLYLGFDLLLQILDQARKIFFANSPPSGGRRGGRHSKLSTYMLTERASPQSRRRVKSSDESRAGKSSTEVLPT